MGGANDILSGTGREKPMKHLAAMAERAVRNAIRPLLGIPAPFFPPIREDWAAMADFTPAGPEYDALAEQLRDFARKNGIVCVDFRQGLADHLKTTGEDPKLLFLDGLHLNESGHRVFAEIFTQTLRNLGFI
jgi:lysophospholipase L1-like esterase